MKRNCGFTLIELIVVVAIIGILSMIAIPQYTDYLMRSRVVEATAALSEARVKMEQHFMDRHSYTAGCDAGGPGLITETDNFTFACPSANLKTNEYVLTATGKGLMAGLTYSINQANQKKSASTAAGRWGVIAEKSCWITSKNGC